MIPETETKRTCATCPFTRHLDGDRYVCTAAHNHHNQVTRGHWEATADCLSEATQEEQQEVQKEETSAEYVIALEASLEKSEAQAIQQEQYSKVARTAAYGVELDSIKPDHYRIWASPVLLGIIRRTPRGWLARSDSNPTTWHTTADEAQHAVVSAALPY